MDASGAPGVVNPESEEQLRATILELRDRNAALKQREQSAIRYIRDKINHLLHTMGTFPLGPEELDDENLIAFDPIGIITESFSQVLKHLHQTNDSLLLARDEIQAIFDSAGAGILVVDDRMRLQAYNQKSREFFFPDQSDVLGQNFRVLICGPDHIPDECIFDRVMATKWAVEQTDHLHNGRHYHVVGTPIKDRDGKITQVVLVYTDITERKGSERALLESEERFRRLYEQAPLAYQSLDGKGRFLEVNQALLDMLGYPREELIGRWFGEFLTTDSQDLLQHHFPRFLASESGECVTELTIVRKDGSQLVASVSGRVGHNRDGSFQQTHCILHNITERKKAEERIRQLAFFDALTDLPNRTLFQDRLNQILAQASRDERRVGILFLDLDRFKGINDTLGHSIGDLLLQEVARRLQECVRRTDTVARLGGDEFVILLPNVASLRDMTGFAGKILETLSAPTHLDGHDVYCTASIGLALYPDDGEDSDTLLKNADTAMYVAKERGRDTFQFFSEEMNHKVVERLTLETNLRRALERDELFLEYQPQLDLATGLVTGVEALLRWEHPELGQVAPSTLIPVAEETGLILPIGEWVLRTACAQVKAWQDLGFPALRVAVNLSARQFRRHDLLRTIDRALAETGLSPDCLELELTESLLVGHAPDVVKALKNLRKRGIHLTIDDFGTGYSSLSYLKNFPIQRLKIAQSFVRDVPQNGEDAAIVEAIIAMSHSLGLKVIAEGVETVAQLNFLRERGCNEMQGYYFSRPVSSEQFPRFLGNALVAGPACLFRAGS